MIISVGCLYKRDLDCALEYAELGVASAPTPAQEAYAQMTIAWAHCLTGKLENGIDVLVGLAPLFQAVRYVSPLLINRHYLTEAYLLAGECDKARETAKELLALSERCGTRGYFGKAHRFLGHVALETRPDEAEPHFEKAISIFQEIKAENELALACSGLGRFYRQRGNTEQAREYLTRALTIFERLGTLIEPDRVRKELAGLPQ
jgi:tetratricopeptide (TPR) repeat protein